MKGLAIILLAALIPVLSAAAQETAPVITLSQSIDAALANGDDVTLLKTNLAVGRAQHAANVSRNSFTLGGSASVGYNYPAGNEKVRSTYGSALAANNVSAQGAQVGIGLNGPLTSVLLSSSPWIPPLPNTTNTDTAGALGLSVSQTLWNGYAGGPAQAAVDKSLLSLKGRELSTDAGTLNVVYRVKLAYFTMFAAQQNLEVTHQILDKQNALLEQLNAIYKLKQASEVDLKTAQINARSAQIDVQNAEHNLRLARIQLAILMGRESTQEFAVAQPDAQPLPAATLADAIKLAFENRVDIRQIELSRKSNSVDLALARGQATPTVSLMGGVNEVLDYNGSTSAWYANLGMRIAMPILDAGLVKNLVDAGQQQDQAYALQEAQLRKGIAATIQNDWENVQLQNQRVELSRMTAENDDLLVEVYRIQNQNGTSSTQDLLTASVNAAAARTAYVQAQSNAQLAVLQLLSDMGY